MKPFASNVTGTVRPFSSARSSHELAEKLKLREASMESMAPLPLMFANSILELGYDLDLNYQVVYASKLLPYDLQERMCRNKADSEESSKWRGWLIKSAELDPEAVDIVLKGEARYSLQPDAKTLVRSMRDELKPWQKVLGDRAKRSASTILGIALSIYGLPKGSGQFVKDAWNRQSWRWSEHL